MPLFQYECGKCKAQTEILVRGSETPVCPECGSARLTKLASAFAAGRAHSGPASRSEGPMPGCGSCQAAGGSCPYN